MVHSLPAVNTAHQTRVSDLLINAGCIWTETFEFCVICEQITSKRRPRLCLLPTSTWGCSGISSEKSKVLGMRHLEVLNARDFTTWMPVVCLPSRAVALHWSACLYIVFGIWLIKPENITSPFQVMHWRKFSWCIDWLVDSFASFYFFFFPYAFSLNLVPGQPFL